MTEDATIPHRPTTQQIIDSTRDLARLLTTLPPDEAAHVLAAFLSNLQPRRMTVHVESE